MSVQSNNTATSERTELRKFGLTVGIVLSLWGAFLWWRDSNAYIYLLIISLVFLFLGLVLPAPLKPIYKAWMAFSAFVGWFMTRFILSVLFFLIITPLSFLARLCGKNFLDKNFEKNANSYWVPRKTIKYDKENYEHQF